MRFEKWQAAGNDFIIMEPEQVGTWSLCELAKATCHRRYGIGADGLMIVEQTNGRFFMRFVNQDGSVAQMCGNGLRCFAAYIFKHHCPQATVLDIDTLAGIYTVKKEAGPDGQIRFVIDMGTVARLEQPRFETFDGGVTGYYMTMGVPHTVIYSWREDQVAAQEGPLIEKDQRFKSGSNVNYCEVIDRDHIRIKTWERGAGLTLACGTGATATVYIAQTLGLLDQQVRVDAPGGTIWVVNDALNLFLVGDAIRVFDGCFDKDIAKMR